MWKIEYENDTGPEDEGFSEWWEVTDGERKFTTTCLADANWLLEILCHNTAA